MFPCKESMEISSKILGNWRELLEEIYRIHTYTIAIHHNEVSYFRNFFPKFEKFINSYSLPGVSFRCKTTEIHQKPIVEIFNGKRCELGDYFVNVKYMNNRGQVLGKKLVIYQFKIGNSCSWKIDQTQLTLLSNWPTFTFGRRNFGINTYNLRPRTPELGSYYLVDKTTSYGSLAASAIDICNYQIGNKINLTNANKFRLHGEVALISQLGWKYGELIPSGDDLEDFFDTLYRYVGFAPDPPDEFEGFMAPEENGSFWGVEIIIKAND